MRTLWLLAAAAGDASSKRSQRFWFDVTKSDWRDTMVLERAARR